ncbi:hypothetical protein [Vulcaniibacterium gelatinicum]|uniref:hypothetical protein n=1 Tax=Vulcaniibacterium gelatinicum TaxID=2598725 RepID=UPI0011C942D8|nr:hypothetical protein [Vulcaniibacterium gelatinicum]
MYSLRHVFWRGAMALSLLALGIGSVGVARPIPDPADAAPADCRVQAQAPDAAQSPMMRKPKIRFASAT